MAKVLVVASDIKKLSEVNNLLQAQGHSVRSADSGSTMRHLLAQEPFQFIIVLDSLQPAFSEALRAELRAGRTCPRLVRAEGLKPQDAAKLLAPTRQTVKAA